MKLILLSLITTVGITAIGLSSCAQSGPCEHCKTDKSSQNEPAADAKPAEATKAPESH